MHTAALITGAGSGIGRALALRLSAMGTAIAAVDCNEDGLKKLGDELQGKGRFAHAVLDVMDAGNLKAGVAELEKTLGPIDLLIASAGVGIETTALDYQAETMNKVIGVNLIGVSNTIAAVLPGMLLRKRGHIVAMSSMASYRGLPRMLGYCASKAGLNALMEGMRVEIEERGVFTTTICPGWVRTPMTEQVSGNRLAGIIEVDDAARRIIWAIQRRRRFYAFPSGMVWQMRIINWLPTFLRDRLMRKMMRSMQRKST